MTEVQLDREEGQLKGIKGPQHSNFLGPYNHYSYVLHFKSTL